MDITEWLVGTPPVVANWSARGQAFSTGFGAAVGIGSSLVGAFSSVTGPLNDAASTIVRYQVNRNSLHVLPGPGELIGLYHTGQLTRPELVYMLQWHGVDVSWSPARTFTQRMWAAAVDNAKPTLPIGVIINRFQRGLMDFTQAQIELTQHGFTTIERVNEVLQTAQPLGAMSLLELLNRGKMTETQVRTQMRANGYTVPEDIDLLLGLRYAMPSPSDLVNFAVREVWDAPVVERFGYDLEFPQSFQVWMDRQGMGWRPSQAGYETDPGQDITWPTAYWRAHWNVMGPGQAGEALYRLRPRAPGDAMSRIPGVPAFTAADYDQMMKIADYPPILRQWFSGLATSVLPVRRIQSLFDTGIVTLDEVKETFKDQAYSDSDAEKLKKLVYATWYKSNTAKARLQLAKTARKGFSEGWMDENGTAVALYRSMLINPDQVAVFEAMSQADKEATALDNPAVKLEIASLRVQAVETIAAMTIRAVQQSALRREVTEVQARQLLATAGIKPDSINEYVRQWNLQLMARGRNATAAQVLKWFQRGSITTGEASVRLAASGYNSADIRLMLGTAAQDQAMSQQKTAEQLAKTQQAKLRAQQQQLKLADANRRRIMADLSRSASRTGILTFLKDGLISQAEAKKALMDRGILDRDASLWIADALKGKASGKATTTSTQTPGQATSNGTVPSPTSPG